MAVAGTVTTAMNKQRGKLYERIGGEATVERLVDAFYDRVLADPELNPFFEHARIENLRSMQREFFAAALDGPVMRSDMQLAHAHHGLDIQQKHFRLFVQHLLETLESVGVSEDDRYEIIRGISTYAGDITGDAGGAGD